MSGTVDSTDLGLLLNRFGFESVSATFASTARIPRAAHPATPAVVVTELDAKTTDPQIEQVNLNEQAARFSFSPKSESSAIKYRQIDYRPIDIVFSLEADDDE